MRDKLFIYTTHFSEPGPGEVGRGESQRGTADSLGGGDHATAAAAEHAYSQERRNATVVRAVTGIKEVFPGRGLKPKG